MISAFIRALEASARADNIWETNCALQTAITNLGKWLTTAEKDRIKIGRTVTLQIVSLLPALPHWDLWGAIRLGWETSKEQGIPPSPFQRVGEIRSPFYSSHFLYQYNGTQDRNLKSRQLLGYSVLAEAEYVDLDDQRARPASIHLRDYFDYACTPSGDELVAYQLYALLLDRLQLGLSGQEVDSKAKNKIEHLYYVAWPIFTSLGRRHFLQLYARPVPDSPAPAAKHLHEAFLQLHQHMSWADLRDILGEELTQVDLDRFHAHVAFQGHEITKNRYVTEEQSEAVLTGLMARNLHLLMPVNAAQYWHFEAPASQDAARWSYKPTGETIPLGSKWTKESSCPRESLPEAFGGLSWQAASLGREAPTQRELRRAFRLWLVERQLRALRRDWEAKSDERKRRLGEAEHRWKTAHYPHLAAQAHQTLGKINHAAQGRDKFNGVTFTLGERTKVSPEDFFQPFFYYESLDADTASAWEDAYHCLLSANGHLVISHFVETGVLHWLTHPDLARAHHNVAGIQDTLASAISAVTTILDRTPQQGHFTCLKCISQNASTIVSKANSETTSASSLAESTQINPAQAGPSCDLCKNHGETVPNWLKPASGYKPPRIPHALADLEMMRERALRSPTPSDHHRLKSMFGLISGDNLVVCNAAMPTIHLAPAGLAGWMEALNKLREGGGLTAFFFAEPMKAVGEVGRSFFGPTTFQRNYLAIFKKLDDDTVYAKIGTSRELLNRLQTFHTLLHGLGFVYCMKLKKQSGGITERFCYVMPEWADITKLVEQINPAVFNMHYSELADGSWEAVVVVLDRVKR